MQRSDDYSNLYAAAEAAGRLKMHDMKMQDQKSGKGTT